MAKELTPLGDRVVVKTDRAFTVGRGQELVGSQPELTGPLAIDEQRRRRQESPVQLFFLAQQVEECAALLGFGLVQRGKVRRRDERDGWL